MKDRIPKVTDQDIERIIARDFGVSSLGLVMEELSKYKPEGNAGTNRVWSAILRLSGGEIQELVTMVSAAILDYRDVIAWSETPLYFDGSNRSLYEADKSDLKESDWVNYQKWFLATEFAGVGRDEA